jgi:serine/threonine protein kinase
VEAFQFIKRLGAGTFGSVELVQEKSTHHRYAMKII